MSIRDLSDWNAVELKATTHELQHITTPKVPPATIEQHLAFATVHCAELKAQVLRFQCKALEAQMWLSFGDVSRATQAVNALIIDI